MQKSRRLRRIFFASISLGILAIGAWALWRYHGPAPEREIFQGLFYGCETLPDSAESGGLVHWVRADLNSPGVGLYITPIDPDAKSQGWEYKLRYVSTSVSDEHLAAAVNGTLFSSDSTLIRLPGDLAKSIETAVADHAVNHVHEHTYLFWWDENLIAHQEGTKPPRPAVLASAKWGIGGQQPILMPDYISKSFSTDDARSSPPTRKKNGCGSPASIKLPINSPQKKCRKWGENCDCG